MSLRSSCTPTGSIRTDNLPSASRETSSKIIQHSGHCGGLPIQPLHQSGDAIIGDPHESHGIGRGADRRERVAQLVRQRGDELILLSILLFQRLFGLLELLPLVQVAQCGQLVEQPLAHLAPIGLRVCDQQSRELFLLVQQRYHVRLGLDLRVQHRPIVRGADESQAPAEELEAPGSDRTSQCMSCPFRARGLDKHHALRRRKSASSMSASGSGQCLDGCGQVLEACIDQRHVALPGSQAPQQTHDLGYGLGNGRSIARRVSVIPPEQEPDVSHDAIAHRTKAGEPDEQPFLENGGSGLSR